jgi:hypothetical protein
MSDSFQGAFVKCIMDNTMDLIYSRSQKRLYRVARTEGCSIDYLKSVDGAGQWGTATVPTKLWHSYGEESGSVMTSFDSVVSPTHNFLVGNDADLYYEFDPLGDQDNFTLYRWVTESHNDSTSTKGCFDELSPANTNYNFDGDWEWCDDRTEDCREMDEWVQNREIYRFSDDSRIQGVSSLTLDPAHFQGSTNILDQVLYSSEEDGDSVSYSDNLESDIMMEATDHSMQFYDATGLNEEEKQAVQRVTDGDPMKWATFKDKLLGGLNETLEEGEVTDVEMSDDSADSDSDYEVEEEEEDEVEEEEEEENHCDMDYGHDEWSGETDYNGSEYRRDEWSGGYYTREEFYEYYGNHSVWKAMHPKKVFVRSIVAYNAHQIYWWPSANFKTSMKMIRDSY